MANAVAKKEKSGFFKKIGNFFGRVGKFFRNMWHEMKKVTWPSRKEVVNYSLVVFAFIVIMGIIIGLIDFGSGALINLIVKF